MIINGNSHPTVAVDATGFAAYRASPHYLKRLKQLGTEDAVVRRYTKAIFAVDAVDSNHADIKHLGPLIDKLAATGVLIECILTDKGYDAEYAHMMIHERLGAEAIIPPRKNEPRRGSEYSTKGKNRSRMKREFKEYEMKKIQYEVNRRDCQLYGEGRIGKRT